MNQKNLQNIEFIRKAGLEIKAFIIFNKLCHKKII